MANISMKDEQSVNSGSFNARGKATLHGVRRRPGEFVLHHFLVNRLAI
jgi:hypothetical protein